MSFQRQALWCLLLVAIAGAIPVIEDVHNTIDNRLNQDAVPNGYRLSKNVLPKKYTIRLEPNIVVGNFTFKGETHIAIRVTSWTKIIVLHAMNLTFDDKYTELLDSKGVTVEGYINGTYDEDKQFYQLNFENPVLMGEYTLKLKYIGILHDDMNGFYRSSYTNAQGEKVWLATTQFEPTYARRAFPCFDEPSFKATFSISITHSDQHNAVSNMPATMKTRPSSNELTKWITWFADTPVMSPYLVAFVVSDFQSLPEADGKFKIFARSNKVHLGQFSKTIAPQELKALENFTQISYELPKLDNFAIPQFRAGAMENWGLVTYRESALLFDEKDTTTETKQGIASVISHEYAHQWFGNLVSPDWWSYTWLNEGFANYFQYWITDQIEPSWRMMDQFVTENLQEIAFTADDNETQHAMNVEVNDPDQIYSIFDSISYSKAGSVIRMFSHVLTPAVFQKGLQNYLKTMAHKAATPKDLIKELVAVGTDITFLDKALESWFTQPGYPVITVTRNHTTGNAVISQKRFLTNASKTPKEKWYVPLTVVKQDDKLPQKFSETKPIETNWLQNDSKPINLAGYKNDNWIILNSQQTGYYRVNYDLENWRLIIDYLKNANLTGKIHPLNRAQLLDDSFHLAQANELVNHTVFLEMTNYLQHETDYIPWYAAHRAFAVLNRALANTDSHDLFKLYIQRLTENLEKRLGYAERAKETDDVKMNRLNVIRTACAMGSAECLKATHEILSEHVVKSNKSSADLQSVALCAGMRSADTELWETAYNYTLTLDRDSNERQILINSLGCSSDPAVLRMYLERVFHVEADINRKDTVKAVYTGDVSGVDVVLDFIKENFTTIIQYDGDTNMILQYVIQIASRMTTPEQVKNLQDFIKSISAKYQSLADTLTREAVTKAQKNVDWVKKYEESVRTFLDAQDLVDYPDTNGLSSISLPSLTLVAFLIIVGVFKQA